MLNELITAIPIGITAFIATNLDDLVILTLLFSQVNATFRCQHVVTGQYLGFGGLLLASLPGFFGGLVFSTQWIGLLGLVPIAIGFFRLLNPDQDSSEEVKTDIEPSQASVLTRLVSPQAFTVAAITFANGADNIGIYVPLFAKSNLASFGVILGLFLVLVGVWCGLTHRLAHQPAIAELLSRYGNGFVPYVLIGLGMFIVLDSDALTLRALLATCLGWVTLVKLNRRSPEVESEVRSNLATD